MITKENIIEAFAANKHGKLKLLYTYYKSEFKCCEESSEVIANRISMDLGIVLPLRFIDNVKKRYRFAEVHNLGLDTHYEEIIETYKKSESNIVINKLPHF